MGILERLRRREVRVPNQELLIAVSEKLLTDLGNGFIEEFYFGNHEEEAILDSEGYVVVLRRKHKYYRVSNHRNSHYPSFSGLSVEDFRSVTEMGDFDNVQGQLVFYGTGSFGAFRIQTHPHGSSRINLTNKEAISLLKDVMRAKVDKKATQDLFELENELNQKRNLTVLDVVVRWPKIEQPS